LEREDVISNGGYLTSGTRSFPRGSSFRGLFVAGQTSHVSGSRFPGLEKRRKNPGFRILGLKLIREWRAGQQKDFQPDVRG